MADGEKDSNRGPQSLHDKGCIEREKHAGSPACSPDVQGSGSGQVDHLESSH